MKPFNISLNLGALLTAAVALTALSPATCMAADITVVNQDIQPVPVKNVLPPTVQTYDYVFQHEFSFSFDSGKLDYTSPPFYIPSGKRLVIEHISIKAASSNDYGEGQDMAYGVSVTNASAQGSHFLLTPAGTTDGKVFQTGGQVWQYRWAYGATPIRLYLDANSPMTIWAKRSNLAGDCLGSIVVTGHFELAP